MTDLAALGPFQPVNGLAEGGWHQKVKDREVA